MGAGVPSWVPLPFRPSFVYTASMVGSASPCSGRQHHTRCAVERAVPARSIKRQAHVSRDALTSLATTYVGPSAHVVPHQTVRGALYG